jgi:CRISPR-associated protein Cmr2
VIDFPPLTSFLRFDFVLDKPFISRDEESFYVIDNPVRKDKVLRLPYVSPSTYKGALRSAARYALDIAAGDLDSEIIERLFGTDRRRKSRQLRQGRLWFSPTFFRQMGIEVINPHARDSGAGTVPIPFETARGAGHFRLLYFPFDLGADGFDEMAKDIEALAKAVKEMFLVYGLAAKKTSGYGVARQKVSNFSWSVHHVLTNGELLRRDAAEFNLNSLPDMAAQIAATLRPETRK